MQKIVTLSAMSLVTLSSWALADSHEETSTASNPISIFARDAEIQIDGVPRIGDQRMNIRKSHQSSASQVYYPPVLLPEWESFEVEINAVCSSDNEDGRIFGVPLRIHVDDKFYVSEIKSKISDLSSQGVAEGATLRSIPYSRFVVFLSPTESLTDQVFYDSARVGRLADLDRPREKTNYPTELNGDVVGTCDELKSVLGDVARGETNLVQGYIYAQEVTYELTEVRASVSASLRRGAIDQIFSEETFEHSASASASSSSSAPDTGDEPLSIVMNLINGGSATTESGSTIRVSQERIVNRNYLQKLSSDSETYISGGCTGVSCEEIQNKVLEFILSESRAIEVAFEKTVDGGASLVSDQITYVTLEPAQYSTLLETAPSFQQETDNSQSVSEGGKEGTSISETDKEKVIVKDDISWKLEGSVPVPTSAKVYIVTDLNLERSISLDWSNATPTETSEVIVDAVYPASGYRRGTVLAFEDYQRNQNLALNCRSGALEAPIVSSNLVDDGNGAMRTGDATIVEDWDSSTACKNTVTGTWRASDGYFFLIDDQEPFDVLKSLLPQNVPLDITSTPHPDNVRKDGNWDGLQAVTQLKFEATTSRGRGSNKSCGAEVQILVRQFPNSCAPYLIEGYRVRD